MNKDYKKIEERLHPRSIYLDTDLFDSSIEGIITAMKQLQAEFPNHTDHRLDVDGHYEDVTFSLYGSRLETEKEYTRRIEANKKAQETSKRAKEKAKQLQDEHDREVYEKLRKKFEAK